MIFPLPITVGQEKLPLKVLLRQAYDSYGDAEPFPHAAADISLAEAEQSFREGLRRFGNVRSAHLGLAHCLSIKGKHRDSAQEFRKAGAVRASQEELRLDLLAGSLKRRFRGRTVLRLIVIPGSNQFVAMVARRGKDLYFTSTGSWWKVSVVTGRVVGDRLLAAATREIKFGGPHSVAGATDNDAIGSAQLYVMRSRIGGPWCSIVYRNFPAANCFPSAVHIDELNGQGFGKRFAFGSVYDVTVSPASGRRGLSIVVGPTYKVLWEDVYDWENGRFILASRRHPELYRQNLALPTYDDYYPSWMNRGATQDILGDYQNALRSWKQAEQICIGCIRGYRRGGELCRDPGYTGDTRINLTEIRKRIHSIVLHRYNDPLLYRPYDFNIQVAPYRLGPNKGCS